MNLPLVLSIAGFDPSGGAGVLADVKTVQSRGCYGFAVTTAITYQTESEFFGLSWCSHEHIQRQLQPLLQKYTIAVVKIGVIENAAMLRCILRTLQQAAYTGMVIWDPVLQASAGFRFFSDEINLLELQPLTLLTPNTQELLSLTGASSLEQGLRTAADAGLTLYVKSCAVQSQYVENVLLTSEGRRSVYGRFIPHAQKHGSGCVLSSLIAAELALGKPLFDAVHCAQEYMLDFLQSDSGLLGLHKEVAA